jgi:hypothetical protein
VLRTLPSLRLSVRRGVMRKVDKMSTVRIGSARYSVPHRLVAQMVEVSTMDDRIEIWHREEHVAAHRLVPPGATSILDEHYDKPARKPQRAVRARTEVEKRFLALGEAAEGFLRAAAAAGTTRLPAHLAEITVLEAAHGHDQLIAALTRATEFRRFTADDVRSILAAGVNAPKPVAVGQKLAAVLPLVPTRTLDAYRADQLKEVA